MSQYRMAPLDEPEEPPKTLLQIIVFWVLIFVVFLALLLVLHAGYKEYGRYQKRADANNQVRVHERLIRIEEQKAEIRRAEARGIADAQGIINETLTPIYIQYLALQTQGEWAEGDNKGVIYLPVGENGIPLIRDTAEDQ